MRLAQLFKQVIKKEEELPEIRSRKSVSEPRLIDTPRCTSCNKVMHPRSTSTIAFICPNCGQGIIIRCKKCRVMGKVTKCPVCGYEYP